MEEISCWDPMVTLTNLPRPALSTEVTTPAEVLPAAAFQVEVAFRAAAVVFQAEVHPAAGSFISDKQRDDGLPVTKRAGKKSVKNGPFDTLYIVNPNYSISLS